MKKKGLFLSLALVAAFAAGSAAIVSQSYQQDTISAVAEEAKAELTISDVNYSPNILGGYGEGLLAGCNGQDLGLGYWNEIPTDKVTLVSSDGTARAVKVEACGTCLAINRSAGYVCSVGDIITFKAGFTAGNFEVKEDISFQYAVANTPWTVYTGEVQVPTEKQALTVKDVNFTNYAGFAGNCIAIGFNVTSLGLADWTPLTDEATQTSKISLTNADGTPVAITFLDSQGAYIMVNRGQTHVCSVGDIVTLKAGFTVGDYQVKEDISYQYTTANASWTIYDPTAQPEPETELKFATVEGLAYPYNANYVGDLTWGVPAMIFRFETAKTFNIYQSAETMDLIEYKNAFGEIVPIRDCIFVGENNFLFRWTPEGADPIYSMVGDTVTFKKGFALAGNEKLAQDVTFVVTSTQSSQLAVYSEDLAPSGLSITTSNEYSQTTVGANVQLQYAIANGFGTAYFTSSNDAVATVTKSGLVTGVAEGEVTITAHLGNETVDFAMTILPASPIVGLEIVKPYTVWVAKDATFALPNFNAHVVFENGQAGADFALTAENCKYDAVDTTVLGDKKVELTITYQGVEYEAELPVTVYEIGDVKIKEIAIVEWFSFAIFIQYPDSTVNNANITTDIGQLDSIFDHITYTRADGTDIPVNGGYMLSGGNIAIFPFGGENLTIDNYNQFYLAGDVIRLEKGLKIYMWSGEKENTGTDNNAIVAGTGMYVCEGILQETVEYRYDGNVWGMYVEYTDIKVDSVDLTVEAGKNIDSKVSRIPANATTGTFTYVSSDETIATVTSRGVIKGLKEGTCTITATLDGGKEGAKTVVLNVTVTDKIVGLNIAAENVKVTVGGTPDLSQVAATYKWASGKEGAAVDLTNATLVGFDNTIVGEQNVVVLVTVDGVEYSGTLTIIVEEKAAAGCGGVVSVMAPLTLLGAGLVVLKKKRK